MSGLLPPLPPHFVDEEIELGEAKKLGKHQTLGLRLEFKS